MTTAHRPTFDPARGKEIQRGPAYHQRLLPAYTTLKVRQAGQGGDADASPRDLRAELLRAEASAAARKKGEPIGGESAESDSGLKRSFGAIADSADSDEKDESPEEKRRRTILEEAQELDADSSGEDSSEESDEESDEEDETAELMRELEKIKRERAEQRAREEAEKAAKAEQQRESDVAKGNPLLNHAQDFAVKRRWDDDVVFKNQARGTEDKRPKEFVNDLLRSDFHKRFMSKYVR